MKIAIIGAGGLGCYLGARLIEAGSEVQFLARGSQLQALQQDGLFVDSYRGSSHLREIHATDRPESIGQVDAVILAVKMYDLKAAAAICPKLMHSQSFILCLQNGVEHVEIVEKIAGNGSAIAGAVYIAARVTEPGHVLQSGAGEFIEIGDFTHPSARAERMAAAFRRGGIKVNVVPDMKVAIWRKFTLVAASGGICALARKSVGEIREDPELKRMLGKAIHEVAAVGRAAGVDLPADTEDKVFRRLTVDFAPEIKASQLIDLEKGKPLELEWLSGAVLRLGRRYGVATPIHDELYARLKPYADGRRATEPANSGA